MITVSNSDDKFYLYSAATSCFVNKIKHKHNINILQKKNICYMITVLCTDICPTGIENVTCPAVYNIFYENKFYFQILFDNYTTYLRDSTCM